MDLDRIMSQGPKRRRLDQGQEQAQRTDTQYLTPPTWSDPEPIAPPTAATQQYYEWASYGNVQPIWNENSINAASVTSVTDYHMGSWDSYSYPYQPQNNARIAPTYSYPNGVSSQWPSFPYVTPHFHEPSQNFMPMFEPSYQQYRLYDTPIGQPTTSFQQWPELSLNYTPPQSLPYHGDLSQNQTVDIEPSSALSNPNEGVYEEADEADDEGDEEIVCFGMVPYISAKFDQKGTTQGLPTSFPVELQGSTRFSGKDLTNVSGQISPDYSQMIQELLDETYLELHVSCITDGFRSVNAQKPPRGPSTILCNELCNHQNLEETPQPSVIKRELRSVSQTSQLEEPPQCYGGIVADPMGLGKTLTMIALVATDLDSEISNDNAGDEFHSKVPTTLIVVPPSLIGTWEEQLLEHVVESGLTYHQYHQKGRQISVNKLEGTHIVLTTYHTISAEWNSSNKGKSSVLFSVCWNRIILDEGKFARLKINGTASLPPRKDMQCPVDFNPDERALYDNLRENTIVSIDEASKFGSDSIKPGSYANVLQQIESLRLVCNIGLHYYTRHDKVTKNIPEADEWAKIAQTTFNIEREMVPILCLQCSSASDITETISENPTTASQNPLFFSCLRFICAECTQVSGQNPKCGHKPRCAVAQVSTSGQSLETSLSDMQPQTDIGLPSKVKALITDIKSLPPYEKCVIFSTWRMTLDIVEAGLEQSSISSVRFDGKVPQRSRQKVVDNFRNDPSVRVMLLTLSCGAAGLTLTVATRAYLMEPHWNPTLKEQALARIHRIGQTQEVTTVRFFMRNSFEHQVIKRQESKKYLAGLLLSPHDSGCGSENLGRLQELSYLI
ncbi:putative SWI/SNF-related matrix-associated actin-dependent regulator of chromatin subfamily A member 3-like protein 1 [Fusarium culmorum]|uniref:Putative SWI/SNF-related matrix-associated actin-dependent regulator of chromatin subfamily A member 3-like protein 1 n=1 Tax=Fusarium culmorum TaxID=5516 RepID=A0A2T4GZF5_FUSCU|nr:putative SWI/SNF-related matrix-associated actin-dependent regulator of chromatin subfamily A member 3-like protein 1 [Fusarium culmorum]